MQAYGGQNRCLRRVLIGTDRVMLSQVDRKMLADMCRTVQVGVDALEWFWMGWAGHSDAGWYVQNNVA